LEKAIEERVPLTKFKRLEKAIEDYTTNEEFSKYKKKIYEALHRINEEFSPLEKTTEVDKKLHTLTHQFE